MRLWRHSQPYLVHVGPWFIRTVLVYLSQCWSLTQTCKVENSNGSLEAMTTLLNRQEPHSKMVGGFNPSENMKVSQLGLLFPIYGHLFQTNQSIIFFHCEFWEQTSVWVSDSIFSAMSCFTISKNSQYNIDGTYIFQQIKPIPGCYRVIEFQSISHFQFTFPFPSHPEMVVSTFLRWNHHFYNSTLRIKNQF